MQRQVAWALSRHFKRRDQCMGRTGPVERINEDQEQTVSDLVGVFLAVNPGFDEHDFRTICFARR